MAKIHTEVLEMAGRIIMENGGETYRVEETVTRMGRAFGLLEVESFAVPSGVFVSYVKENGTTETAVVRVRRKGTNLTRVDEVNRVSRLVEQEGMTAEEAHARLREIEVMPPMLTKPQMLLAAAIGSAGFALMFGGDGIDFIIAFIVGIIGQAAAFWIEKSSIKGMASSLAGSFIVSALPMLFHSLTWLGHVDALVAGTLMPLLPGLAMTNAIQDTLRGDMVSGVAHAMQALLTAALVAAGVLMAVSLFSLMGGAA
ncbi:MAG: threonine/serine exporter family protein [Clostridia bacterium]|nr:threonine/serine exporter family protein [Clostridia bacterium]